MPGMFCRAAPCQHIPRFGDSIYLSLCVSSTTPPLKCEEALKALLDKARVGKHFDVPTTTWERAFPRHYLEEKRESRRPFPLPHSSPCPLRPPLCLAPSNDICSCRRPCKSRSSGAMTSLKTLYPPKSLPSPSTLFCRSPFVRHSPNIPLPFVLCGLDPGEIRHPRSEARLRILWASDQRITLQLPRAPPY